MNCECKYWEVCDGHMTVMFKYTPGKGGIMPR